MPQSTSKYAESLVRLHPAFRKLSKKNGPITCEQLRRASTLHTACIGIAALKDFTKDSQWTRSQRHSFTSCNRLPIGSQSLRSLLLLAGSLQFHVDLTFRLRFGIRKSMHQLEAMPQSGPCMQLLWYISFVYYLIIYIYN